MSEFLARVQQRAAAASKRIAFAEATDVRTLQAVSRLQELALAVPLLVGTRREIETAAGTHNVALDDVAIIDPQHDHRIELFAETYYTLCKNKGIGYDAARAAVQDPLVFAALLVRAGDADGSLAGAVRTTAEVLRVALRCLGPAPGIRTVSAGFYMVVPPFRSAASEVLTFADASVVPEPSVEQLADIAEAAAVARTRIVGDEPRIAFLSFSTYGSAAATSTERVRAAQALFQRRRPEITADGELQADAALIADIAARKAPGSALAGQANVLIFPNLDAGNIAYKLVQRLAHAEAVGPVLHGLSKPCNDLSRGASADDIVNVACITALQAEPGPEQNLPQRGAAV